MKRKSEAFFRCAMRARSTGFWFAKGDAYFHALRYLSRYRSIKGLRPYK